MGRLVLFRGTIRDLQDLEIIELYERKKKPFTNDATEALALLKEKIDTASFETKIKEVSAQNNVNHTHTMSLNNGPKIPLS